LLAPNSEYRIRFGLTSFASRNVENNDPDELDETEEGNAEHSESSDDDDATLRTIRFITEAAPTQDSERYVGLTWPAVRDGSASPHYPDHFRPFFTLKNDGLIHKVYGRHYNATVLRSEIVDIDGTPLAPEIVSTINIGSSPLDDTFEDVVSQCLPNAQQVSWARLDLWQAQLATSEDYSMQLTDLRQAATAPLWSRSFRTSAFRTFAAHVDYVEALLEDAQVLPSVNPTGIAPTLASLIGAAQSGSAPGRDALVEAIYRDLLGIDGGSLRRQFGTPDADFAGHIIGQDETGERLWGIALELDEPLIGRQGLVLPDLVAADAEALAAKGIFRVNAAGVPLLLVVDTGGTRVVILNSADAVTFTAFAADAVLALRFAPGDEVALLARRYMEATSRPLSPADFETKFNALMAVIAGHPDLGINLGVHNATLALAVPPELIPPPVVEDDPDGDGDEDEGGGGGGGGPWPRPFPFPRPRPRPRFPGRRG
jgi:hypothetical protein